jgi:restriction modification system DNA specificity domain protein
MKSVNQYLMKDSGVQWIGQVPEHWEVCKVKNICTYVNRGCTPNYVENGTYYAMNQATFSKGFLDYSSLKFTTENRKSAQVLKQDILLASTGGGVLGKVWYYNDDVDLFYAVADVIILRVNPKEIDARYLYYDLSIKYQLMNALFVNGSTNQIHLQRDLLKNHYIQCPPLSEQRAIADWLDAKCADIDAAIELQQRMIDKLKAYKTAVIHQAVTKGLDKNASLKDSGVQWIGEVPQHWEGCKMQYIIHLEKGKMPKELTYESGDAPYLTMDLLRNRESMMFYPIATEGLVRVEDNDLLLLWDGANAGEILQAKRGYLGSTMAIIHYSKEIIESKFAFYFFKALEPKFKEDANGTTIPHFNRKSINGYWYFLPPTLTEQRAIADWLDAKCADIDATIALKEQKQEKLKAYKKTIIFEYVTGKKQVANINKQL